jgi:hypothetical protein
MLPVFIEILRMSKYMKLKHLEKKTRKTFNLKVCSKGDDQPKYYDFYIYTKLQKISVVLFLSNSYERAFYISMVRLTLQTVCFVMVVS